MDLRLRREHDEQEQPTWPPLLRTRPLEFGCLVGVGFALGFGAVATIVVFILVAIFGAGLHASLPFLPTPTP